MLLIILLIVIYTNIYIYTYTVAKYTTYETSSLRILVLIFAARLASASSTPEAAESWLRRLQDRGRGLNCVVKFESRVLKFVSNRSCT